MLRFNDHLYHPSYDEDGSDQRYLDEGFVSSIKEKLGMAPPKSKFRRALDSIKSKFNSQKSGAFGQAHEYLKKVNKGRLAAKAGGALGINLLANKLSGRTVRGDLKGFKTAALRGSLTKSGADLGGMLYDHFAKK